MGVWIEHDSQFPAYRFPTGAVATNQPVLLSLRVTGSENVSGDLRFWQSDLSSQERRMPLISTKDKKSGGSWLHVILTTPAHGCLLWYQFELNVDGQTLYFGNNAQSLGGYGELADHELPSFQITVYEKTESFPTWMRSSVMYQIFPDRFFRSETNSLAQKEKAVFHLSWKDKPNYFKDSVTQEILAYDFFGGNLKGIREKLPYLKELGVSVIYLNPIFEAESNHRYDTGNYKKIDELLGTSEDLKLLCKDALENFSIKIILDGVFNHTGSNSVYFNREGKYDSLGAAQSRQSPYFSWYDFQEYPTKYASWWGVDTLPCVNELDPSYLDFVIRANDSVLKTWMKSGISGWRLDVIDELPPKFLKLFYQTLKQLNPNAALIGEVWEDASNKVSYNKQREYLCGGQIDSAMNYPWRVIVLDFLLNKIDGFEVKKRIASLYENYPKQYFYSMMNLLGSHDVPRILTLLGEAPAADAWPQKKQANYFLPKEKEALARSRLKLALLWQMTFPGMPCVYYGDEIGAQGFKDPYNRAPYDWNKNKLGDELLTLTKAAIHLRNQTDALKTGDFLPLESAGDVYSFARFIQNRHDAFLQLANDDVFITVINRNQTQLKKFSLSVGDFSVEGSEFVPMLSAGESCTVSKVTQGKIEMTLPALSGVILKEVRPKIVPPKFLTRQAGILFHPTCLPSSHGIGDFGAAAYEFVDFLKKAGQHVWQILPLNPVDQYGSPYSSSSAFAGNPLLISLEKLVEENLLTSCEIFDETETFENLDAVRNFKNKCLQKAFENFKTFDENSRLVKNFKIFIEEEKIWLDDYALFAVLHEEFELPWYEWNDELKQRNSSAMIEAQKNFAEKIEFVQFKQFLFFAQWNALHEYAKANEIKIFGDMPLFVSHDSADVWANKNLFALNEDGSAKKIAGVPPDYFSREGQRWGNPQYNWQAMQENNFSWFVNRVKHLSKMVDIIRIDHFRGLASYWEIDAKEKTAINGRWQIGPREKFFNAMRDALGEVHFIAEDLGVMTKDVIELRERENLPGMHVLEFALSDNGTPRIGFVCHENSVVYTGTHDNNTLKGWFEHDLNEWQKPAIASYLKLPPTQSTDDVVYRMIEFAYASRANLAIIPLVDILALDEDARLNRPGQTENNWSFRLEKSLSETLNEKIIAWLTHLTTRYNR